MNIQLFNFLEDNISRIESLVVRDITINNPQYHEILGKNIEESVNMLVDGYIDLLITNMTDYLDKLFRYLSRIVIINNNQPHDIVGMPLLLSNVIHRLLIEEYGDSDSEEEYKKYNEALVMTQQVAHKAAARFLDVFDEYYDKYKQKNILQEME